MADVAIPAGIRRNWLYQNLVDVTLRFLIEEVGGAEGVHRAGDALPENFLARRATGHAVEAPRHRRVSRLARLRPRRGRRLRHGTAADSGDRRRCQLVFTVAV